MSKTLDQILREYRSGLEAIYGPRLARIILFGSRARQDAQPDSDIDIVVVLRGPVDPNEEIRRLSSVSAALSLKYDVVISAVYVSEDDYDSQDSALLMNVRREGILV
jgi:predicted nucleotidyltransferase